jgi:hypothetical protein
MAETEDKKDKKETKIAVTDHSDSEAPAEKPATVSKHSLMTEQPSGKESAESQPKTAEPTGPSPSNSKVKIEPISKPEDLKPEEDKGDKKSEETDESADSPDAEDATGETGRDKLKDASQDEQELQAKKEAEHLANLNKIALAKTYYLPINQVVRRRSKHVAIAGTALIVILCLAWVDVSLDADLITIPGVKAPTHFFDK